MGSVKDVLAEAIRKAGGVRKLAPIIGIGASSISNAMTGRSVLGDEAWIRIAEYIGSDPKEVIILNHLERSTPETRPIWTDLLKRNTAALLIIAATIGIISGYSEIAAASNRGFNHYQTLFIHRSAKPVDSQA